MQLDFLLEKEIEEVPSKNLDKKSSPEDSQPLPSNVVSLEDFKKNKSYKDSVTEAIASISW